MSQHQMNEDESQAEAPAADDNPAITGPSFAASETAIRDLSAEIVAALGRSPGEVIKCRRIVGNHYRCNWWAPLTRGDAARGGSSGLAITTQRVIKSRLLHVTRADGKLMVEPEEVQ